MCIVMLGLLIVCSDWPQTSILPISTSQVAEITSVSHGAQPKNFLEMQKYFFFKQLVTSNNCC
jgi:hypothetical protein